MKQIALGTMVRDTVSGFTGLAYCRVEYERDEPQIGIRGNGLTRDGSPVGVEYFAESKIEPVAG